jgi:ABC-type multidrug transport system ATPase subunit
MLFETRDIVKTYAAHTALNKVSIKVPEKKYFWFTWAQWSR